MTILEAAAQARINFGTPAGEEPCATLARGLFGANGKIYGVVNSSGDLVNPRGGRIGNVLSKNFLTLDTTDQISALTPAGAVAAGTGNSLNHLVAPGGLRICHVPLGTQTITVPVIVATGLDIGQDQTDNDGVELFTHFAGADGRQFTIGYDTAFYFQAKFVIADVSAIDTLLVGFRRAELNNGTYTSYADYAALGWNTSAAAALIKTLTGLNGTDVATTTTNTIADTVPLTVRVNVSGTGIVTYQHDALVPGQLSAPTATTAFTFDNGDPVIPFFHYLHGSGATTDCVIQSWEVGYAD